MVFQYFNRPTRSRKRFRRSYAATEALEKRALLATISGVVWRDVNEDGDRGTNEAVSPGVSVYVDANDNRQHDANELLAVADSSGVYELANLPAGDHIIRMVPPLEQLQTSPRTIFGSAYDGRVEAKTQLFQLDPITAHVRRLGSPTDVRIHGIAVTNQSKFIGVNGFLDSIYEVDLNSGVTTLLHDSDWEISAGLTHDPYTDTVYGISKLEKGATGYLTIIDKETGEPTQIGPGSDLLQAMSGLAFNYKENVIYAFDNFGDEFLKIDLDGTVTKLSNADEKFDSYSFAFNGHGYWMQRLDRNSDLQILDVNPHTGEIKNAVLASEPIRSESLDFVSHGNIAHRLRVASDDNVGGINFGHTWTFNDFVITETHDFTIVTESGITDTFSVVLSAPPTDDVVLTVVSDDAQQARPDTGSLTFTAGNWNVAQHVQVSADDDGLSDISSQALINVAVDLQNSDPSFHGTPGKTITVTSIDNDSPGFAVVPTLGTTAVSEAGLIDQFDVVLTLSPSSNVVLDLDLEGNHARLARTKLTFTPQNWDTAQTVGVEAVQDDVVNGLRKSLLTVSVVDDTSDDAFDNLPDVSFSVVILNDDRAAIVVDESDGSTIVTEQGSSDSFDVTLAAKPRSVVVLDVSSDNVDEAKIDKDRLTFTNQNWNVPQAVTVTGLDDNINDDDRPTIVRLVVNPELSDVEFDHIPAKVVHVRTNDNDVAGITVVQTNGSSVVEESGSSDTVEVRLTTRPLNNVKVDFTSDNSELLLISPASLTFTPENWNVAQVSMIAGVDNAFAHGDSDVTVTIAVDSELSDSTYFDAEPQSIVAEIQDDESAEIEIVQSDDVTFVSEHGTDDFIDVTLKARPVSNVTLNIAGDDSSELLVQPSVMVFEPDNWDVAQRIRVTGIDDSVADGDIGSVVTISVDKATSHSAFADAPNITIDVVNLDNDLIGFSVVPTLDATEVSEVGSTDSLQVVLTAKPDSNVVLTAQSADTTEVELTPTALTFTPDNWDAVQEVTVTGQNDREIDGTATVNVTVAVDPRLSDSVFRNAAPKVLVVTNLDDDANTPVVQTPVGRVDQRRPDFIWESVENVDLYRVVIENLKTGETIVDRQQPASSYRHSEDLALGRYRVRVQATLRSGSISQWAEADFRVSPKVVAETPVFHSPTARPTFTWPAIAEATSYEIWAINLTSQVQTLYETVTQTEFTPDFDLPVGVYRFWHRAVTASGFKADWSESQDVSIGPLASTPVGLTFNRRPEFRWSNVPGLISYQLKVQLGSEVVVDVSGLTSNSYQVDKDLLDGEIRWWVRGVTPDGLLGKWSPVAETTIGGLTSVDLEFSSLGTTSVLKWPAVEEAATYALYLRRKGQINAVLHQRGIADTMLTATSLADGEYEVWVWAERPDTSGTWGAAKSFTLQNGSKASRSTDSSGIRNVVRPSMFPSAGQESVDLRLNAFFQTGQISFGPASVPISDSSGFRSWVDAITSISETDTWSSIGLTSSSDLDVSLNDNHSIDGQLDVWAKSETVVCSSDQLAASDKERQHPADTLHSVARGKDGIEEVFESLHRWVL